MFILVGLGGDFYNRVAHLIAYRALDGVAEVGQEKSECEE
jgi:hypothetical protein